MEKNSSTSPFVNTADVMEALNKNEQMAQRILRQIRAKEGKTLKELVTVLDYARYFNITEAEAKIALKRTY